MKILLVDDDNSVLEQAKIFLEKEEERLNIETASYAERGLELLNKEEFDAIVSDYQMPEMDGLEFLQKIREERKSEIPFIIFTGKGREDVAMEALNLGANRYLQKQGDPKTQYGVLAQAIVQEVKHYLAEEKIWESEQKYRAITEKSHDAIFIISENGFLFVNDQTCELTGYSKEELYDIDWGELLHPEDRERVREIDRKGRKGEKVPTNYEAQILTKGGESKLGNFKITPIEYEDEFAVLGTVRDITERKEKEKELREANERLNRTQKIANVGSWEIDLLSDELTWSEQTYRIFGVTIGSPMNYDKFLDLVHPDDRDFVDKKWNEALNGEEYDIEHRIVCDGETKWVREKADIKFDDEGEPEKIIGSVQDITEWKKKEKEIVESKEKYQDLSKKFESLFEGIPDAATFVDEDGIIREVNQKACEHLECNREDLVGMPLEDQPFYSGEDRDRFLERVEKVFEGEKIPPTSYELKTAEGSKRHVEVNNSIIRENGEFKGLIIVGRDITERKRAEKKLRKSEEKYRQITENANVLISFIDLEGNILYANQTHEDLLGYKPAELVDENIFDFHHPDDVEKVNEKINEEFLSKEEFSIESRVRHKDGSYKWFSVLGKLLTDEEGDLDRILLVGHDVTKRKKMEEELRESEEYFRAIFEMSPESITITDLEGEIIDCNRETIEQQGFDSKGEVIGKNSFEFFAPEDKARGEKNLEKTLEEGRIRNVEYTLIDSNGDKFPAELSASVIRDSDGNPASFMAITKDITERKEYESKLHEKQEALESSINGIAITDLEGKITYVNPALLKMEGYEDEKEIIGKNGLELIQDTEKITKIMGKVKKEGEWMGELKGEKKDGETFDVQLSISLIEDEDGNPKGLLANYIDITERKRVEKREEFLHSLLRHDLKNKANVIKGYLEKMEKLDLPEKADLYLEETIRTTDSQKELIEKVRTLRKIEEAESREIEISQVLDQAITENERGASEKDIQFENDITSCKVKGGLLLEELFSNLIENSIKHSGCKKIWIKGYEEEEYIVTVIDDGKGIPDEKKEKIFERGFKEGEESGFGLGLYLVKKIVENYGGDVKVEDSEYGGTKFIINLNKA